MGYIPFSTIHAFSQTCLDASKPEDISSALTELLGERGIFSWFVGSLPFVSSKGSTGFGLHSMPERWLNHYLDVEHFDHDPVFQHAMRSRRAATWSECRREYVRDGGKARSVSVFDEAAEFGLTDGLILPMRGIGDYPGAVTYGGNDPDLGPEAQMSLYLVGAYAYEGMRRLVEGFKPAPPSLTDQELEILRWTSEGKSATVIGAIVKLSPHTVREHQQNIKDKYRVASLIQVAVFATVDGNLRLAASR
jgi:LuxR family transcriptional regulator, quorum-sensing system regulator BjaR1